MITLDELKKYSPFRESKHSYTDIGVCLHCDCKYRKSELRIIDGRLYCPNVNCVGTINDFFEIEE